LYIGPRYTKGIFYVCLIVSFPCLDILTRFLAAPYALSCPCRLPIKGTLTSS